MSTRKTMLLAALAAMGMSSPAFATPATNDLLDFLPPNLGKKRNKPRKHRSMHWPTLPNQPAVKREHKDRHKKGRP